MSLLLAMVVQIAFVPFHLAFEDHDGVSGAVAGESGGDAFVAPCKHGHDHEQPRDNHPCHAVQDHGGELMVPSVSSGYKAFASYVLLSEEAWSLPSLRGLGWCGTPEVEAWFSFAGHGGHARGPPAIV